MATVRMADGSDYNVSVLLADGDDNTKLAKSNASQKKFLTVSLSLSPANESGYETCASRSPGCTQACLFTAGMGRFSTTRRSRIAKTRLLFQQRSLFVAMLKEELRKWVNKASKQGRVLACRLNVVSDIMWEKILPELFTEFPHVQFYDYTKHAKRMMAFDEGNFPANYHLTFSRSETNEPDVCYFLINAKRSNIAVVFDSKELPETWHGWPVYNGDQTDLRFMDPSRHIIGLYAKGQGKKDVSGFVVSTKREP